jgi:hypothetical protein
MDLDTYRGSAEEFVAELDREFYRHYAGLKDDYELEPIYDRHRALFERGAVEELRSLAAGAVDGSEQQRRLRMLLDFAVDGHLGQLTRGFEEEIARREATLSVQVGGERIGFREVPVRQANEPDADRRAELEQLQLELLEREFGPLYEQSFEIVHASARELGWGSYRELTEQCKGLDLGALQEQTSAFAAATTEGYPSMLEPELERTAGVAFGELRRSDLPRLFRATAHDRFFPSDRLVPTFVETMRGIGIDVERQEGLVLDVEPRASKSPRAFCAPVRKPGEVYLVLAPVGGFDDYETLFHEGGHAEHSACADPALAFEFRHLGDDAISEGYAFLFQYLVDDPEWLRRRLGVEDAEQLVSHARAQRLVYLRRYSAKLAYELELHGPRSGPLTALSGRYSSLLSDALRLPWPQEPYLADVDPGFYCACYLRAWALETHLRGYLRDRFGVAWFEQREAGEVLRTLWRKDKSVNADELLFELTGRELDFGALAREFA